DHRPYAVIEVVLEDPRDVDRRGVEEEVAGALLGPLDESLGRARLVVLDVGSPAHRQRDAEQRELGRERQAAPLKQLNLVAPAARKGGAEGAQQLRERLPLALGGQERAGRQGPPIGVAGELARSGPAARRGL